MLPNATKSNVSSRPSVAVRGQEADEREKGDSPAFAPDSPVGTNCTLIRDEFVTIRH